MCGGEADGKGLFIVEFEEIVGYFTVKNHKTSSV